jgi:hypothetical protein
VDLTSLGAAVSGWVPWRRRSEAGTA